MSATDRLRIGSSYYPPMHEPADWPQDLDRMIEHGLTVIRTAELLTSWDRIEVAHHTYDFDWLDRLFDLAAERGMRIVLGTGSCCPPVWMSESYPDLQIVSREGVPYPIASSWSWACRDHPGYREELTRWIRVLAARYGNRPELLAWQIDNEIGYPFVARQGRGMDLYCYCEFTEGRFRAWLAERYGSPEALSDAWRWDPTHHRYSSWSQVRAPRSMPSEWGVVTAWLDWRRFIAGSMASFVGWQRELLSELTPGINTMTNVFIWSAHDPFGVWIGQDPWRLAREADVIGYDFYPGIGERNVREPEYAGMFLDFARCSARAGGADYWLAEVESGPINGWVLGPDHATDANDILRMNADALGSGANAILYQGYREWNCIPIHWGALADLEGEKTARLGAVGLVAEAVEPIIDRVAAMRPPTADVALLHDFENAVAVSGMEAGPFLEDAIAGAYRALAGSGFGVDFVSFEELEDLDARLLVLPFTMLVPRRAGSAIATFVRGGGTVLAFAKGACLDDRGWWWDRRPGADLDSIFGAREASLRVDHGAVKLDVSAHPALPGWDGGSVEGFWHRQVLAPQEGATVLARFEDGSIAATLNRHGRGKAILIGTHLDVAVRRLPGGLATSLIAAIADGAGARRLWNAPLASDGLPRVYARTRSNGASGLLTVTSTAAEPIDAVVHLSPAQATDLITKDPVPVGDGLLVRVPAAGSRYIALEGL